MSLPRSVAAPLSWFAGFACLLGGCSDDGSDDSDTAGSDTSTAGTLTDGTTGTATTVTGSTTGNTTSGPSTSGATTASADTGSESSESSGASSESDSSSGSGDSTGGTTEGAQDTEASSSGTDGDGESSTGTTGDEPVVCRDLEIEIDDFFPEGITADADGMIYVGSLTTQQIVRRAGCSSQTQAIETFVDDPTLASVVGILVDDVGDMLWVCNSNGETFVDASIRGYALDDGALVVEHPFGAEGAPGFCNDLTLDGERNLYATDSAVGRVMRVDQENLLVEGSAYEWAISPAFEIAGSYSLNGIAYNGDDSLYSIMSEGGLLFRFDLPDEGAPNIVEIELDRTIEGGDGLEWIGNGQLLVNENAVDRLSVITLAGASATVETVIDDLEDQPTTSVLVDDTLFIVQSQLTAFQNDDPETLPFRVVTRPRP